MKRYFRLYFFWFFVLSFFHQNLPALDNQGPRERFFYSQELENKGDIEGAFSVLQDLLKDSASYPQRNLALVYFNLGIYSEWMGRYEESLHYLDHHARVLSNFDSGVIKLSNNYNGKASVYDKLGDYDKALQYYEAGIRLVSSEEKNPDIQSQLSKLYLNLAILLINNEKWEEGLDYLLKSKVIKEKYGFLHLAGVYLNLGRVYAELEENEKADWYFHQSIEYWAKEYGAEYWQLGASYEKYGLFLLNSHRWEEAEFYLGKAHDFYLERFGTKNSYLGWVSKYLGDLYFRKDSIDKAVVYYQIALIESVKEFNSLDPEDNPAYSVRIVNSSILSTLIAKAQAFKSWSQEIQSGEQKLNKLRIAYNTIQIAHEYFNQLINTYSGTQGRLFLASDYKDLFILGTNLALQLYEMEGEETMLEESYLYASAWKSAELMRHIQFTEVNRELGQKDSLVSMIGFQRERMERLSNRIRALNEAEVRNPIEIETAEEELFAEARSLDSMLNAAKKAGSYDLLLNYNPSIEIAELQSTLDRDQVILEYLMGSNESDTGRKIYVFVISREKLSYIILEKGGEIQSMVRWYIDHLRRYRPGIPPREGFDSLLNTMHLLYKELFRPVENLVPMRNVIVVPDDELYYLPFETLVKTIPDYEVFDFSSLDYLLKYYSFNLSYSVAFWMKKSEIKKRRSEFIALAPEVSLYSQNELSGQSGFEREINFLMDKFKGKYIMGNEVTRESFQDAARSEGSILHIAAHAEQGDVRGGGYILLGKEDTESEKSRLYEYEISTMEIRSLLVNLSACNTGSGYLSHGEGIYSLGRSFMQAGVPSVIYTLWEVNDARSSILIRDFYKYLLDGEPLDISLQQAKLDYLDGSPSYLSHPYYWAGYQLAGNISSFRKGGSAGLLMYFLIFGLGITVAGYFIFRRPDKMAKASS